jgi:predicted Zn-dependent protease
MPITGPGTWWRRIRRARSPGCCSARSRPTTSRGYSRGQEKEADRYGTHIAFNAGYNPTFMTKFFLRLYESNPKSPWKLLATHPPTTERIEYTTQYLEAFPLDTEMQIDSQEFKDMKARLK